MHRNDLEKLLAKWLRPEEFTDSAMNGLQIEGRSIVRHIVCGVSANMALFDEAISQSADAVFVHHGIFWDPGLRAIRGWKGERIRRLVKAGVSLFAYHIPLDAHPLWGNNAGLANAIDLPTKRTPFGSYKGRKIGVSATYQTPTTLAAVVSKVQERVGAPICVFGDADRTIRAVGICSGGASDMLAEAVDDGLDLLVTGEPAEWAQAIALESGVAFVAAGHHATERFGPRSIAEELAKQDGLTATFVDIPNPV